MEKGNKTSLSDSELSLPKYEGAKRRRTSLDCGAFRVRAELGYSHLQPTTEVDCEDESSGEDTDLTDDSDVEGSGIRDHHNLQERQRRTQIDKTFLLLGKAVGAPENASRTAIVRNAVKRIRTGATTCHLLYSFNSLLKETYEAEQYQRKLEAGIKSEEDAQRVDAKLTQIYGAIYEKAKTVYLDVHENNSDFEYSDEEMKNAATRDERLDILEKRNETEAKKDPYDFYISKEDFLEEDCVPESKRKVLEAAFVRVKEFRALRSRSKGTRACIREARDEDCGENDESDPLMDEDNEEYDGDYEEDEEEVGEEAEVDEDTAESTQDYDEWCWETDHDEDEEETENDAHVETEVDSDKDRKNASSKRKRDEFDEYEEYSDEDEISGDALDSNNDADFTNHDHDYCRLNNLEKNNADAAPGKSTALISSPDLDDITGPIYCEDGSFILATANGYAHNENGEFTYAYLDPEDVNNQKLYLWSDGQWNLNVSSSGASYSANDELNSADANIIEGESWTAEHVDTSFDSDYNEQVELNTEFMFDGKDIGNSHPEKQILTVRQHGGKVIPKEV